MNEGAQEYKTNTKLLTPRMLIRKTNAAIQVISFLCRNSSRWCIHPSFIRDAPGKSHKGRSE